MNWLKILTVERLNKMFKKYPLYSQEDKKDPLVILEIFIPNTNIYWLLTEGNQEDDDFIFFGYCKIQCGEYGYFNFNTFYNLKYTIKFIYHKKPIKLRKIKKKYYS